MKLGFKVPSGTCYVLKEYSEDELYNINKSKVLPEDIKQAITQTLFNKKRNFHISIKEKGAGERVDWKERINDELTRLNIYYKKFIYGLPRTAKVKYMVLEQLKSLKGHPKQIDYALEQAINRNIFSVGYVRTVLSNIKAKDSKDVDESEKETMKAEELMKELRDYDDE